MLKNYLKIAVRALWKDRRFTLLNLFGLSTGLACALLIVLWVQDELSTDRFHSNNKRLYQVMEHRKHDGGIQTVSAMPAMLAPQLPAHMPGIVQAVTTTPADWFPQMAVSAGSDYLKRAAIFAGSNYFSVFSWQLLQGHAEKVLADKNGVVISEQLAQSLFHTTDNVIGRTMEWKFDDLTQQAVVTGIFAGTPANSSIQFDLVLHFDMFRQLVNINDDFLPDGPFTTYAVLQPGADAEKVNAQLSRLMSDRSQRERTMFLEPYGDHYLHGNYEQGVQTGGRIWYVNIFSLIAVFIILMACINFMNMYTAKASVRMKEMGIRKAIGAGRGTLIAQYLGEAMLMTVVSLVVALLLVLLLLPKFNAITGKALTIPVTPVFLLSVLGITILTGLLAGSYPAFYLSGFNPVAVLKGRLHRATGELWTRKGLVVFQFALSVSFIIATLVVYQQVDYIQSRKAGYDKDNVISFTAEGRVPGNMQSFTAALKAVPGVENASSMVAAVQGAPATVTVFDESGKQETMVGRPLLVQPGLIETLGIPMAAGLPFSSDTDTGKVVLNETAVKVMGLSDPVGKVIRFGRGNRQVIGVTKDFHFQSMHESIKPLFFFLDPHTGTVMVKLKEGQEEATIKRLAGFYRSYNPGFAFEWQYLDQAYQAQYRAEKRVAALSRYFAGLAVIISCIGLFGLAAFTAERRRKEIGIRKVLGATVADVSLMMGAGFVRYTVIAILVAAPLSWWGMHSWLQTFAYHITLGPAVFLIAGGGMLALTIMTVGAQTVKAAIADPVKSLRSE